MSGATLKFRCGKMDMDTKDGGVRGNLP
jgi:hypothetical protein